MLKTISIAVAASRVLALSAALATPLAAQEFAAQAFSAKTVTLLIGFAAGGGYDTYGRVISRHLGRHLPGNPSIVPQNMPGGGSLNVANLIYNVAPKDGSQLGLFASSAALEPVIGNPQAKFDTAKFVWVGNINKDVSSCGVWHTSGIKTWDDAIKKGTRFGGVGLSTPTTQHAAFLSNVLGAPFKVITGYSGTNDVNLAMQRGEVDGSCGIFLSSGKGPYFRDISNGNLKLIIQLGRANEPFFGDATNVYSLIKSEEDRRLADFVFLQTEIARPIAASPQTPEPLVALLRRAFDATMLDPEFLADAARSQLLIAPMTGADTAKAFAEFAAFPRPLIDRAKAAMTPADR